MMRAALLVGIVGAMIAADRAAAIECQSERPAGASGHYAWREIDGRRCWYQGERGMAKSKLAWARATPPASVAAKKPPEPPATPLDAPAQPVVVVTTERIIVPQAVINGRWPAEESVVKFVAVVPPPRPRPRFPEPPWAGWPLLALLAFARAWPYSSTRPVSMSTSCALKRLPKFRENEGHRIPSLETQQRAPLFLSAVPSSCSTVAALVVNSSDRAVLENRPRSMNTAEPKALFLRRSASTSHSYHQGADAFHDG